jgi:hypothetical protein
VVTAIVETLAGAAGALQDEEPAAAFLAVPGIHVWHWRPAKRSEQSSKMHAKLAIADRQVLFVTSANLTQAGMGKASRSACSSGAPPPPSAQRSTSLSCKRREC